MKKVELKECPFCGSKKVKSLSWEIKKLNQKTGEIISLGFRVFCKICATYGPKGDYPGESEMLWNKREKAEK